jgi:signal transduction histidine kinase
MLDQSSLPAAVCGPEGLIQYCNGALASLLGRPAREVQGRLWADLWSLERPEGVAPAAGQGPAVEEIWLATGTPIRVRWHRLPMPAMGAGTAGPEGAPVRGVLMLGECLSRLDRLEAENRFLGERLSYARRGETVGRYAGRFAHDFNNLLGGILGFAELAEDNLRDGIDCREEIVEILESVSRGRALVEALLDTRRRFMPQFQALDVSSVLQAELENMPLAVFGLEIRRSFEPNLPAARIDPDLSRLLLFSLLRLFARFVDRGTVLTVSTREYCGKTGPGSVAGSTWIVMELMVEGTEPPPWWRDWEEDEFWGTAERPPEVPEVELSAVAGLVRDHRGWWSLSREPGGITARVYFPTALSQ